MTQNSQGAMKMDDLEVGQTLIGVEHFGFSRTIHRETPYRVVKKMKTRLVVALLRDVAGSLVSSGIELRFVVRDGAVTQRIENRGERYGLDLHTEDDEMLPGFRAETKRSEIRSRATAAAETAHTRLSRETAERAVVALQAYLDSIEGMQ